MHAIQDKLLLLFSYSIKHVFENIKERQEKMIHGLNMRKSYETSHSIPSIEIRQSSMENNRYSWIMQIIWDFHIIIISTM